MKMENAKRMSVTINKEMENKIIELRKTDEYCRCSYSEIIRKLIEAGMKAFENEQKVG